MPEKIVNIAHAENIYISEGKGTEVNAVSLKRLSEHTDKEPLLLEEFYEDELLPAPPSRCQIVTNYYIVVKTESSSPYVLMQPFNLDSKSALPSLTFPHTLSRLPNCESRTLGEIRSWFDDAVASHQEHLAVAEETLLYSLGIQQAELSAMKSFTELQDGVCTYVRGFLVIAMDDVSLFNIQDPYDVRSLRYIYLGSVGNSRFSISNRDRAILASEELKESPIILPAPLPKYGFCIKAEFDILPAANLLVRKMSESLVPTRMLTCMKVVQQCLVDQLNCGYVESYSLHENTATITLPENLTTEEASTRIYEVIGRLTGNLTLYFGNIWVRTGYEDVRKQLSVRCMVVERKYSFGREYPDSSPEATDIDFPAFPDSLDSKPAGTSIVIEKSDEDLGLEHLMDKRKYSGNLIIYHKAIK